MLIDSHCHLDHSDFQGEVEAILARARNAGVRGMLTIGTSIGGFSRVLAIAERHSNVYCTVGVHPHDAADEADVSVEQLVALSSHPKVVGIGECGLDFFYNKSPQEVQIETFRVHVAAARASRLPLVVHSRDADDETAAILDEGACDGDLRGVLHCFSSGPALAAAAVRVGFLISFSGILTFKKSENLRDIARGIPLESLLVETDAPYLAPVPMRGRRNEPSFVGHTLDVLAACRGEDRAALADATTRNFLRLFDKVEFVDCGA
jgi:TatD DNase family protein